MLVHHSRSLVLLLAASIGNQLAAGEPQTRTGADVGARLFSTRSAAMVQVAAESRPSARFSATCAALTCTFDGRASSGTGGIKAWMWDCGAFPNCSGTESVVTFTYPHAGPRTIRLIVRDSLGFSDDSVQMVILRDAAETAAPPAERAALSAPRAATVTPQPSVEASARTGPIELPALPTIYNPAYPTATRTIQVPAGSDLQSALNRATCGDELVLPAGAAWAGRFTLPAKACQGWIIVRSSLLSNLPAGVRVTPASAANMATIGANSPEGAIHAAPGAHNWYLAGLNITVAPNYRYSLIYTLTWLGDGDVPVESQLPSDIVVDRSWIHGTATLPSQNGVVMNGKRQALVNSYCSDIHMDGVESHCISSYAGVGPFKIVNNTLAGGMLTVLFGGARGPIMGLVPKDIEIRRNYVYHPDAWFGKWGVKNLLEFKNGQRILVEENIFEGSWASAQVGFCWHIIPMASDAQETYATVTDVTARRNICRKTAQGLNLSAYQNGATNPLNRVLIEDMILEDVGTVYKNDGRLVQILNAVHNLTIRRLTATGNVLNQAIMLDDGGAAQKPVNVSVANSLFNRGTYGFYRNAGLPFTEGFSGTAVFSPNAIMPDVGSLLWPAGTRFFPSAAAAEAAGFGANRRAVLAATADVKVP